MTTNTDHVVVWGASGKTGRALTCALHDRGWSVHGISRVPEQQPRDAGADAWSHPDDLADALVGARAAWFIGPNMASDELDQVEAFARAAVAAGVDRLGYHSVLNPQDARMGHHLIKGRAEELIATIHSDVVIVRPSAYHQNLTAAALSGDMTVPYRTSAPFRTVDLDDVAVASAALLSDATPVARIVELVGPTELTIAQMADQAASVLGRPVTARFVPAAADTDPMLRDMFAAYDENGFLPTSGVGAEPLEDLLGAPATSWAAHVHRAAWATAPPSNA